MPVEVTPIAPKCVELLVTTRSTRQPVRRCPEVVPERAATNPWLKCARNKLNQVGWPWWDVLLLPTTTFDLPTLVAKASPTVKGPVPKITGKGTKWYNTRTDERNGQNVRYLYIRRARMMHVREGDSIKARQQRQQRRTRTRSTSNGPAGTGWYTEAGLRSQGGRHWPAERTRGPAAPVAARAMQANPGSSPRTLASAAFRAPSRRLRVLRRVCRWRRSLHAAGHRGSTKGQTPLSGNGLGYGLGRLTVSTRINLR
eukprot:6186848-Pleurochrysis_carterae.AAC.2